MRGERVEVGDGAHLLDVQADRTVRADRHADEIAGMAQREPRTVREHGLAVLGPAAAGAVEDERPAAPPPTSGARTSRASACAAR